MAEALTSPELGPRSCAAPRASSMHAEPPPPLDFADSPGPTASLGSTAKPPPKALWLTMNEGSSDDEEDLVLDVLTCPSSGDTSRTFRSRPRAGTIGKKVLNSFVVADSPRTPPTRAEKLRSKAAQRQMEAAALARQQLAERQRLPDQDEQQISCCQHLRKKSSRRSKQATGFEHGVRGQAVQAAD